MRIVILLACLLMLAGCSSSKQKVDPSGPFVYVEGEVKKPGKFPWTKGMTLQDAIRLAGGLSEFASKPLRVRHLDGSENTYKANRDGMLLDDAPVQPGDVLFSPYD